MVFALVLATGCGAKVTRENYDKVSDGMTIEEVNGILGKPTDSSTSGIGSFSGTAASWHGSGDIKITVQFMNGKVLSKQFHQP